MNGDDDVVRAAFDAVREMDGRETGALDAVLRRSPAIRPTGTRVALLAAAAMLIVFAGVGSWWSGRRRDVRISPEVLALARWSAPTDVFLPARGQDVPHLNSSILKFNQTTGAAQ